MNWLCRFGIHSYGKWVDNLNYIIQYRYCSKCNKRKERMI